MRTTVSCIVQIACYYALPFIVHLHRCVPLPLTYTSQTSFNQIYQGPYIERSMHLLPANPAPIRITRNLQLAQPIKTRLLPAKASDVQIMRAPPRETTFPLPRGLHILPLLTLRLAVQQPHFLEINIGGVKGRALTPLLGAFAFEEFGQVTGLDLLIAGKHGC